MKINQTLIIIAIIAITITGVFFITSDGKKNLKTSNQPESHQEDDEHSH